MRGKKAAVIYRNRPVVEHQKQAGFGPESIKRGEENP